MAFSFSFFFFLRQGFETVLHTPIAQSYMGRVCGAVQPPEGGSADRAVKYQIVKVATARESPDLERLPRGCEGPESAEDLIDNYIGPK